MDFSERKPAIELYDKIRNFVGNDLWQIKADQLPRWRRLLIRSLRVLIISFRGYSEHRCSLRASALTFYSLLSLVPVAAMLFGIAKGFGYQKRFENQLLEQFSEHGEVVRQVIEFSRTLLESTKGGVVAGIGVLLLFWTLIRVMGNIERSFNDIWNVREGRTVLRKFTDYMAIMLVAPFNFILSSSATVIIASQITDLGESLGLTTLASTLLSIVLTLIPWILMWFLFGFAYVVVPNTSVRWKSGLVAGLVAGVAFQLTQIIFIDLQIGASSYNAIYGGFAALPLFLVWLQLSWMITLLGAELSCAMQNIDSYENAPRLKELNLAMRKLLTLYVAQIGVKLFQKSSDALTIGQLTAQTGAPATIVQDAIESLIDAGLFAQLVTDAEPAYQPSTDIQRFTIAFVLERLDETGSSELPVGETQELRTLQESLTEFNKAVRTCSSNRLLAEI
ncbi:MAG: YihY/virulence factor BrkB family protein [bacterium]|nr:YihY/virulence factor BrkB family protein [bacterium]